MLAVMAAPERYSASNPAALACKAAMPLCAPGICRMPPASSSARKRSPAGSVGRSAGDEVGHAAAPLEPTQVLVGLTGPYGHVRSGRLHAGTLPVTPAHRWRC